VPSYDAGYFYPSDSGPYIESADAGYFYPSDSGPYIESADAGNFGYAWDAGNWPSYDDAGVGASCADWTWASGSGRTPYTATGADNDFAPSCGGAVGADVAIAWIAPSTGRFRFDTFGTGWDTVLAVYAACGGAELVCNDDANATLQSQVTFDAIAGTTYIVVIDSYGTTTGDVLTLGVAPVP
jgi:hypothetical protein